MSNQSAGGGVGFVTLLGLLFIGLKLAGVIDWSWWWVLLPLWIPWGILGVLLVFVMASSLRIPGIEIRRD